MSLSFHFTSPWKFLHSAVLILCVAALIGCGGGNKQGETPPAEGGTAPPDSATAPANGPKEGGAAATETFSEQDLLVQQPTGTKETDQTQQSGAAPTEVEPLAVQVFTEPFPDRSLMRRYQAKLFPHDVKIYDGPYEEFYPGENNPKFSEGTYKDGRPIGLWSFYHSNGQLAKQGEYVNGKPDGKWVHYRPDGTLEREENYKEGKADGQWIDYFDDGKSPQMVRSYKNDKPDGTWTTWHTPEQPASEFTYKDGLLDGVRKRWYPDGKLFRQEEYTMGKRNGVFLLWDRDGNVISRVTYRDNKRVLGGGTPEKE